MSFDPKAHIMNLKGKDYLPVSARLVWLRTDHPEWSITTTVIEINTEKQYAIFQASIADEKGNVRATATGSETARDFGDFIEKAETKAVGRALGFCCFGTANCGDELDEMPRVVDSPQGGQAGQQRQYPPRTGNQPGGYAAR